MFSRPDNNVHVTDDLIIFRLNPNFEDESVKNICYNYANLDFDVTKQYEEIKKLTSSIDKIEFFNESEKNELNTLANDKKYEMLSEKIYTDLNCVIISYSYGKSEWTFKMNMVNVDNNNKSVLDDNMIKSIETALKFYKWGFKGELKCQTGSGILVEKLIKNFDSSRIKDKNNKELSKHDRVIEMVQHLAQVYKSTKNINEALNKII